MKNAKARASSRLGYALVASAASVWGTWPFLLGYAKSFGAISPLLQSTVVMFVVSIVSMPFTLRDRVRRRATAREWLGVVWLGVGDMANVVLFFAAYATTRVSVAVLTHYLTPIFVALVAPFALGERARLRTFVAVVLSFTGLVLLLAPWQAANGAGEASAARSDLAGALLGAGSAVFYASNVLVTKRLTHAFSGAELTAYHAVVSFLLLLVILPTQPFEFHAAAVTRLTFCAIGPGALSALFFVWGLRRVPASHASTLTLLEPLVAVLGASLVFRSEPLTALGVLGGVLILGGAGIVMAPSDAPSDPTGRGRGRGPDNGAGRAREPGRRALG